MNRLSLAAFALVLSTALAPAATPPPATLEQPYLYEIVRHVYRWYLDENDVERAVATAQFPFWIERVEPALDEGDHSEFAQITMPLLGVAVRVKKADYRIEELDTQVQADTFKITNVLRVSPSMEKPADAAEVDTSFSGMRDYLFRTRSEATFPDDALLEHLKVKLREAIGAQPGEKAAGRQLAFLSPLSPVANEWWVYWETRHLLVRFTSDIDLTNPGVWDHDPLKVQLYDVATQVVVSMDEAPGSNVFMTRDQVGRALFNCVVLGKKLEITNPEAPSM